MKIDPDRVANIIRDVAADEILPRFRNLAAGDVQEKSGPADLVTVADLAAEREISRRLSDLAPGVAIIGEEAVADDPRLLSRIADETDFWLIDPVDGTYNFANGSEPFGVIVALVRGGRTVAGWIHTPVNGDLAVAELGSGGWLDSTDKERTRLQVARADRFENMIGALYAGATRAPELYERVKQIRDRLRGRSYSRCVAFEYLALARGDHHFALFTRLMPWDHAAGIMIHAEAGGHGALFDGTPYGPDIHQGTMLLAPDEPCWSALHDLFAEPG